MTARRFALVCVVILYSTIVFATAPEPPVVLVGATVIDVGDHGRSKSDVLDAVLVMHGGRITAIGPRGSVEIPAEAMVVEAGDRFIVPGLIDGFAALNSQHSADAYLACGVTSIIAVSGGRRGSLFTEAETGPRIRRLESIGEEAASVEDHLADLEVLAAEGIEIALLMYAITPDQLPALVSRASDLGLATIGELGHTSYEEGIAAGLDAVVHTTRYSLGLAPPDMARAVAEQPFSKDLGSPKWRYYRWLSELSPYDEMLGAYAKALTSGRTHLMPTLSLLYLDRPWARNPWKDPVSRLIAPASVNNPADPATGRHTHDAAHQVAYAALARSQMVLEQAYHRAGARYLAGSATDVWGTMPGISLHHELEGLVRVGLEPREALAAATSSFASAFPSWGSTGRLLPGWAADLLVLTEDPREDIAHLRSIEHVVLGGQLVQVAQPDGRSGDVVERRLLEPPPDLTPDIAESVRAEAITYISDGLRVNGFLLRPTTAGPHPCVIYARGGNREFGAIRPRRVWGLLARMASWGYVVAATQYRGVDGGDGSEEFGGADVDDLLALLPVLEAEPGADASRVGIYGGSRGGLMTYLALSRSDRFSAAAVRSGVSDALSWVEQRPEMAEVFAEIVPGYVDDPRAALLARSPARWAEELAASTPLLILHGTADWRVPPDAALRMASALQAARRPYRLVLLEGSDHALHEHRDEHDRQVRGWFDRFVRDGAELPDLTPHGD